MMSQLRERWQTRYSLIIAVSLILVTNSVALYGVWNNRADEPESILTLSQRELWPPHDWRLDGENSATMLMLRWRVHSYEERDHISIYGRSYANTGGVAEWCNRDKLRLLGFDLKDDDGHKRPSYYYSQLSKEVFLVLELDGVAYQKELMRVREMVKQEVSASSSDVEKTSELATRLKTARSTLKNEENKNSRLFVVDAGRELNVLRNQYPDQSRYAIVRGKVKPRLVGRFDNRRVMGYISDIATENINVPYAYRKLFEPMYDKKRRVSYGNTSQYEVKLAFGKRLEPWIMNVSGVMVAE